MRFFRDLSRAKARRRLNVRGVVSVGSFRPGQGPLLADNMSYEPRYLPHRAFCVLGRPRRDRRPHLRRDCHLAYRVARGSVYCTVARPGCGAYIR